MFKCSCESEHAFHIKSESRKRNKLTPAGLIISSAIWKCHIFSFLKLKLHFSISVSKQELCRCKLGRETRICVLSQSQKWDSKLSMRSWPTFELWDLNIICTFKVFIASFSYLLFPGNHLVWVIDLPWWAYFLFLFSFLCTSCIELTVLFFSRSQSK